MRKGKKAQIGKEKDLKKKKKNTSTYFNEINQHLTYCSPIRSW